MRLHRGVDALLVPATRRSTVQQAAARWQRRGRTPRGSLPGVVKPRNCATTAARMTLLQHALVGDSTGKPVGVLGYMDGPVRWHLITIVHC